MYTLEDHYLASGSVGGGAETTKKPRRCGPSRLSAPSGGQKLSRTATSMPFANKRTTKRHEFTIFYILHMNKWRTEMRTRIDKVVFIDWASELTLSYNFYFPFLRGGADDLYFIIFFWGSFWSFWVLFGLLRVGQKAVKWAIMKSSTDGPLNCELLHRRTRGGFSFLFYILLTYWLEDHLFQISRTFTAIEDLLRNIQDVWTGGCSVALFRFYVIEPPRIEYRNRRWSTGFVH